MGDVYLEITSLTDISVEAPIETALCFCIYNYLEQPNDLNLKMIKTQQNSPQITINISNIRIDVCKEIPQPASYCSLPVFQSFDGISCVAGLSAVLRQIVKCSEKRYHNLLGFREACLVACAETSIWTKFCEVELIDCCKRILLKHKQILKNGVLPIEFARLEMHMSQPIRVHNVSKLTDKSHKFVEGPQFFLTDLVLSVPVHIIFKTLAIDYCPVCPRISEWYLEVTEKQQYIKCLSLLKWEHYDMEANKLMTELYPKWTLPTVNNQSLYKRDPTRYKPRHKIYTQQEEILENMNKLENINLIDYTEGPKWEEKWADDLLAPEVPEERLTRKRYQLANLAAAAIHVAIAGTTIVDFCSGSGHLGLILAKCLPNNTIILLDNKEKSLDRARQRIKSLNLSNIFVIQANLDYFVGKFQVGVSLHACGVATDLVIHKCLANYANFVVCPCCYGGIQENHIISYPQSREYLDAGLTQRGYIVLGHCADQAGSDQGEEGMRAVDSDRCFLARNKGYLVTLSKLFPLNCTTRNNILIGIKPKPTTQLINNL